MAVRKFECRCFLWQTEGFGTMAGWFELAGAFIGIDSTAE
jgi:hypothetical protein